MSPATKAVLGKPEPLIELVRSGQVGVNEQLTLSNWRETENTTTPLCALIGNASAASTVDLLLSRGADVNFPCSVTNPGGLPPTGLPLDVLMKEAISRASIDSPYRANKQYRPQDLPILLNTAEKLLARGAKVDRGTINMIEIKQEIAQRTGSGDQWVGDQKQVLREKEKDSFFTKDTLMGVVAIAGATASNYAVIQGQQQAAAKLGNNILADSQHAADTARENNERRAREARADTDRQREAERARSARADAERATRADAERSAERARAAERQAEAPKYQPQVVILPKADLVCPPGSTWQNATGTGAKGGTCYVNPQAQGQTHFFIHKSKPVMR